MKKYDIKPDHHIRAKRASLTGLTIGLLLLFQAVRVLWHFPENEGWRNALAGVSGLISVSYTHLTLPTILRV